MFLINTEMLATMYFATESQGHGFIKINNTMPTPQALILSLKMTQIEKLIEGSLDYMTASVNNMFS